MKNFCTAAALCALLTTAASADEYIGNYSANKHNSNSTSNPNGAGSPYSSGSPSNPYGEGLEIYGE